MAWTTEKQKAYNHEYYLRHKHALDATNKAYYQAHRDAALSRAKENYHANRSAKLAYAINYQKCKPSVHNQAGKRWRDKNPEKQAKAVKKWARQHPGKIRLYVAQRRLAIRRATPSWVSMQTIFPVYTYATMLTLSTGIKYAVDHIWPLKGKTFSGLHVPWNLQIITKRENSKKGTRSPADYYKDGTNHIGIQL